MLSLRSYLLIGFLNLFTLPLYTGTTTFLYRKKILCQEISVIISWVLGLDWVLQTEDNRLKIFAKTDWNKSLSKWLGDRTEPSRFNLWLWLYFYKTVWYISMKVRRRKTLQKPNKPYILQVNGHQPLISSIDQNVLALELLLE